MTPSGWWVGLGAGLRRVPDLGMGELEHLPALEWGGGCSMGLGGFELGGSMGLGFAFEAVAGLVFGTWELWISLVWIWGLFCLYRF